MKVTFKKAAIFVLPLLFITLASQSWAFEGKAKRNMMKDLDTDGDGAVSFEEFQNSPDQRFQKTDTNNDGLITLEEMQQRQADRAAERQSRAQERLETRFTMLDSDSDGAITLDEAQRGIFDRLDSNGDGVITRKEAKKAKKVRKQRRRDRYAHEDEG